MEETVENIKIVTLAGDSLELYPLIGPLVMNATVLKANCNYPFKTAPNYIWYIYCSEEQVKGFIPLEYRPSRVLLNNYYVENDDEEVLGELLKVLPRDAHIDAMVQIRHQETFIKAGYKVISSLVKFVKMSNTTKNVSKNKNTKKKKPKK
jgi:hypothetical protein